MNKSQIHTFHIPVMGLGFTIDTPVKVARFGIASVISIIEDGLIEQMRKFYCEQQGEIYEEIKADDDDSRAKRITAYLNHINQIVKKQIEQLGLLPFGEVNDLTKYFELLPDKSLVRNIYDEMIGLEEGPYKQLLQKQLREKIVAGSIDVNIMSKIDKTNYAKSGEPLPAEFSDAVAAFRGFANSELSSSVVFSAGYNPRLYAQIENYKEFYPDEKGILKKKIILKVSDYRSALIQGKLLAKKGLWVSEFRIESGLNCGGHAFATDGILLGPILEEFKNKKQDIEKELFEMCNQALTAKEYKTFSQPAEMKVTVQGGIGTANENKFLFDYYNVDGTGWGSPFLLVPETTNVDDETLQQLATAKKEDYFLSDASPLGIPFNNFRRSSSEKQRKIRIEKGRPGSPCYKKFLAFDTEFTTNPICTASRQYQDLKIKQLKEKDLSKEIFDKEMESVVAKDCLCEGLAVPALIKDHLPVSHGLDAVAICPGPNLAYFSGTFSLREMVNHIYGRANILNNLKRPNMFVNELSLYVDYLKKEMQKNILIASDKRDKYISTFRNNLLSGVNYYKNLLPEFKSETEEYIKELKNDLNNMEALIVQLVNNPQPVLV